jgi:hypothetical protein
LQIGRERLGQQRKVKPFRRSVQKQRGDDEVPQSPQLNNEQFWFQSGRGRIHIFELLGRLVRDLGSGLTLPRGFVRPRLD